MPKVHIMNVREVDRKDEAIKRVKEIFINPTITFDDEAFISFKSCNTQYQFVFNDGLYRWNPEQLGWGKESEDSLSEFDWDEHPQVTPTSEILDNIRQLLIQQGHQIAQIFEELEHMKKPKDPEEQSDENSLYKNWILGLLANIKSGDLDVAVQAEREIQVEYLNQIGAMPKDFTYEGLADSLITHFEEPKNIPFFDEYAPDDDDEVLEPESVSPPETVSRDTVDLVRGKLDTFNRSVRDQLDRLPSGMGEVRAMAERLLTTLNNDMDELLGK